MRSITATEASRNFAALLDAVEAGESVIVTRSGLPIARVEPESRPTGRRLKEILVKYRDRREFADVLAAARADVRKFTDETVRSWPG